MLRRRLLKNWGMIWILFLDALAKTFASVYQPAPDGCP
jgi:hypothetical protein